MSESEFFMRTIGSSSSSQRTSTRSPTFTSGTLCFFFSCAPPVRATSSTSPPSFSSLVRFLPTSAVSPPLTLSLSLLTSPSLPLPTPPPPRLSFTGGETGTPHGSAGEFIPSAFRASILSLSQVLSTVKYHLTTSISLALRPQSGARIKVLHVLPPRARRSPSRQYDEESWLCSVTIRSCTHTSESVCV